MPKGVYKRTEEHKKALRVPRNGAGLYVHYPQQGFQKGHRTFLLHHSDETKQKIGETKKGENNSSWKGESVKYAGLHNWKKRWSGNPPKCEDCGIEGKYIIYMREGKIAQRWSIEWSNVSREYHRDLDDFIGRCISCHKKYDLVHQNA